MVNIIPSAFLPKNERPLVTVGVLADTHIPDRRRDLDPLVLAAFQDAGVDAVFHAGDICTPSVLRDLSQVAPVTAVRGNRDWLLRRALPLVCTVILAGVEVGLTHGHGGFLSYLLDKGQYIAVGYKLDRYHRLLMRLFPTAEVIIFGHTHRAENRVLNGRLIFNPGSACCDGPNRSGPSFGILRFYPDKRVHSEIIPIK